MERNNVIKYRRIWSWDVGKEQCNDCEKDAHFVVTFPKLKYGKITVCIDCFREYYEDLIEKYSQESRRHQSE